MVSREPMSVGFRRGRDGLIIMIISPSCHLLASLETDFSVVAGWLMK